MKISLRFNFYVTRDTLDSEINRIHFKCLEHYKNVFNDVKIRISVNDLNDYELIEKSEKIFFDIFKGVPINLFFEVKKNDPYFQESLFFKEEVVDKLDTYDLVFFAHNKGITNVKNFDVNNIYLWVTSMYYFNLHNVEEVKRSLLKDIYYAYGSFLTQELENEHITKYGYRYLGTFFWMNGKRIYNNTKEFPTLDGRTYDENFLGNVIRDMEKCSSHKGLYYIGSNNLYYNIEDVLKILYSNDLLKPIYDFYNEIKEKI